MTLTSFYHLPLEIFRLWYNLFKVLILSFKRYRAVLERGYAVNSLNTSRQHYTLLFRITGKFNIHKFINQPTKITKRISLVSKWRIKMRKTLFSKCFWVLWWCRLCYSCCFDPFLTKQENVRSSNVIVCF